MLQFDVLFDDLGEIGFAQVLMVLIIGSTSFSSGINSLATVFIAYEPDFRCNVPYFDNKTKYPNMNQTAILNLTTPFNFVTKSYDKCNRYDYNVSLCHKRNKCFNTSFPPISCDEGYHYDRSLFNESVVTKFDLVCSRSYLNTLSVSLYYAGIAFGAVLFGNLGDRIGRKRCVLISYVGILAFMVGISFSSSVLLYTFFRFGLAACLFGAFDNSFTYTTEIIGKKWRAKFSFWNQIAFAIGYMILVIIAYKWRSYDEIMLACTIFCTPFLFLLFVLPESPRWLFTQNRNEEGIRVVNKIARINRVKVHEKKWNEAKRTAEQCYNIHKNAKKYTALDLFKGRKIAVVSLKIMFLWFVNSMVYYGVALNSRAMAGDFFLNNLFYSIFEIASYVVCIAIIDRFGRTTLETLFLMLTGLFFALSLIVNAFANENQSLITLGSVLVFLARSCISCSYGIIYYMTAEIFPTVVRTNAVGVGSMSARIAGVVAPLVVHLQDVAGWLPNVTFSIFSILAGLLSLSLPETNGHNMMETIEEAEIFYGDKNRKRKPFKYFSPNDVKMIVSEEETIQM